MKYIGKLPGYIFKLILVVVFAFPFVWMILTSLMTYKEVNSFPPTLFPNVFMFSNYIEAWNSAPFLTFLMNSIIITVVTIVLQVIIMVPTAYALAKCNFRGKGILFVMVLIAFMVPEQITYIPIYMMFVKWGMLNTLIPQILPFIANPFGIFLLRQYFMQIPDEIIESAQLDNASQWQTMFRVMLPMSKGAMVTALLFSFVKMWNSYFWPLVMTNTTNLRPLTVGVAMLTNSEGAVQWQIIMAANVILVIPILLTYLFASKKMSEAFVYSGIK